ncbi:MAG: EAL domain-containing protein [Planctomycetaceae bacterium]|nr:EAL domain-containing protein [Planctomycetaceae bacterium]
MRKTTEAMELSRRARGWSLVAHGDGEVIPLRDFPCKIGRQPGVHVRLGHTTVSLQHAELRLSGDDLVLVDKRSRNGTFINGRRLKGQHVVVVGDLLQFGAVVFRLNHGRRTCAAPTSPSEDMGDLALAIAQFDKLIDDRVVVPHFQPIVAAEAGEVVAYEALARSRLFGLDNPAMMFKAAEFFQKEALLSRILRSEALSRTGFRKKQHLFLNTHPAELRDLKPLFVSLEELRNEHPDQAIAIEVHETCAMDPATIKMLRLVLNDLAMQLAYDDFGAGQARLSELVEAHPDFLKFDRKLIAGIDTASRDRRQLLESLIHMCRQLGIITLAEGVESSAEAEACRGVGFDLMQGYFFGRPVSKPLMRLALDERVGPRKTTLRIGQPEVLTERIKGA